MELRHLRYFVAAAEAENVSRAALRLHVSQPALSRQIHDLEDELRFPLFERSAKAVHLTDAGRVFLAEARAVLERADEAVRNARAVAAGDRGELHIGYAPSPTARILPLALRMFQRDYPKMRVRLHDLTTEEMLSGLRVGRLALAFMVRPGRARLHGLQFEELTRDTMCLAIPPGHALSGARSVRLDQVRLQPLVIFSRSEYPEYKEYLDELFVRARREPRIAEEHDSSASLIAAIESGAGVAVLPRTFACSVGPRLELIPIRPAPAPLVLGAVWPAHKLGVAARRFLHAAKVAITDISKS